MAIQGNSKRIAFWASYFRKAGERKKIIYRIFAKLQEKKGPCPMFSRMICLYGQKAATVIIAQMANPRLILIVMPNSSPMPAPRPERADSFI